jgi:hypothetical protein
MLYGGMSEALRIVSPVSAPPLDHTGEDSTHSLRRPSPPTLPPSHSPTAFQALCGSPFVSIPEHALVPSVLPVISVAQWSYNAFRNVVVYLTVNKFTVAFEDAVETLALADAYCEPSLRSACLQLIQSRVDVDNAVPLLIQADHVSFVLEYGKQWCTVSSCVFRSGSSCSSVQMT